MPAPKKGMGLLPKILIGCGALSIAGVVGFVLLVVVIGIGASKAVQDIDTSGQPSTGDVRVALTEGASGEIAAAGNANKKSRVTILRILDDAKSSNQFTQPTAGKKYWAVQVTQENVGTAEVSGLDWKLRDSKDQELTMTFVSGIGESLPGGSLTPGGKRTGYVIFQIDADASPKWLRADPNPFLKNDLYFDATSQ